MRLFKRKDQVVIERKNGTSTYVSRRKEIELRRKRKKGLIK